MKVHITVNGVPYCQAPIYQMMQERGIPAKLQCKAACSCGYGECQEEAQRDAQRLREVLNDAEVVVSEGECNEDPWWNTDAGIDAQFFNDEYEASKYDS